MCLAVYKPVGVLPNWQHLENGHDTNNDSWGFAAVQNGELHTYVGLGEFEQFRSYFEPFQDCQAVIHFRYATHGKVMTDNCHPFLIDKDLAVIHNGIIDVECNLNQSMSDTWHYVEVVLKSLHRVNPDFFMHPATQFVCEQSLGANKLCFLRSDGTHAIWNKDAGDELDDGTWYSNTGYKYSRPAYSGYYSSAASSALSKLDAESSRSYDYSRHDLFMDGDSEEAYAEYREQQRLWRQGEEDEEDTPDFVNVLRTELWKQGLSFVQIQAIEDIYGAAGLEALNDLHS